MLAACAQVVALAGESALIYQDARGIARALIGDRAGAIEDFRAYVQWSKANDMYEPYGKKREDWIATLTRGANPFDEVTLAALREE